MPLSELRATLVLLSPLLLLSAVLTVPLERGAPKEDSPATESPVSGPALLSSQVFAVVLQFPQTPVAPGCILPQRRRLGVCLPFFAVPGL